MRKRSLGKTGYSVSEIGFGAWGLGGGVWRGVDSRDAQRALYVALDSGIDLIDTALVYDDGLSENLVGEVIRDQRARDWAVLATKVPPLNRVWPARDDVGLDEVFPPDYVVNCVEQSLRNTRAEVLGIEQLHVWRDDWLESSVWPDVRGAMARMIQQGKVLHWGISINAHDPASALKILDDPLIGTVQVIYNIFDPCAGELLSRARERDVGVIARCPFDEGSLTGTLTRETEFLPGDFRRRYFVGERLEQAVERAEALAALCGDEVDSLPELALRFCVSAPDVGAVIPGMRRVEHVRANIASAQRGPLSAQLLDRLREHAWDKNWYR